MKFISIKLEECNLKLPFPLLNMPPARLDSVLTKQCGVD